MIRGFFFKFFFYSGFVFYPSNFLTEILLKLLISNLIWIPIHLIWLYAGVLFYELPLSKTIKNLVRYLMAISLILVVILSLASV